MSPVVSEIFDASAWNPVPGFDSLTDITYKVEVSSDLQTWQSGSSYTVRVDNGTTDTATYRDAAAIGDIPRHFIRLSVVRP